MGGKLTFSPENEYNISGRLAFFSVFQDILLFSQIMFIIMSEIARYMFNIFLYDIFLTTSIFSDIFQGGPEDNSVRFI